MPYEFTIVYCIEDDILMATKTKTISRKWTSTTLTTVVVSIKT